MKKIVFMGTPNFAVPILNQLIQTGYEPVLVVTQPDRPKGRKRVLTAPPVKVTAEEHGIPVFQPEKVKDDYQQILDYQPDLIITAAFGQILPKGLLEAPTFGCVNVHASLLPELRGGAPIHAAIMQGKTETGITIMYMAEKLDAGAIISQKAVPITESDHVGTMHDKLSQVGAELLIKTLPNLFEHSIHPQVQDEGLATYAPNITRDQEKIDWHQSALSVYNQIRGLHPWPVASTQLGTEHIKVWWADLTQMHKSSKPGEIVDFTTDGIIVCCGDQQCITLKEIQPAGKKRITVEAFLRGKGKELQIGDRLGEADDEV